MTQSYAPTGEVSTSSGRALYLAIWRWHFYAGLLCLPLLLLLAVTGSLYLFKTEINLLLHPDWYKVPSIAQALPPDQLAKAALSVSPGTIKSYHGPAAPDQSAIFKIDDQLIYLNPANGRVLGQESADSSFMQIILKLHSLELFGVFPNRLIEIVGAWAIILVISGIYLWWPRGAKGGVVTLRGRPKRRVFWRDLHAVTGAVASGLILFLALSGMPWTGVWGQWLNSTATAQGIGYPAALWDKVPHSGHTAEKALPKSPWITAPLPLPESTVGNEPIGLDRAVAIVTAAGMPQSYDMTLPDGPHGVYTAAYFPDDVRSERMIHIDQYSGAILTDLRFAEFGWLGRTVEWGINLHTGRQFGLVNQLIMLAACLSIIVMCISAAVMWWKRRPTGRIGVPPAIENGRLMLGVLGIFMIGGLIFPLAGLSILVALTIDRLIPHALKQRYT